MKEKPRTCYAKSVQRIKACFTAKILRVLSMTLVAVIINSCERNSVYDPTIGDPLKTVIQSIIPTNLADSVFVDPIVSVTFKADMDPAVVASSQIDIKKGSTVVPGTINLSETTASFIPDADLAPESDYTATIRTTPKGATGNSSMNEYSWKFTTGKRHRISSLSVVSVSPANKATGVAAGSPLIITFNQVVTTSMTGSIAVVLKNGTTSVPGNLVFAGKTATFQPAAALAGNTLYTGKVSIATTAADAGSDKGSVYEFTWSFTTAGSAADVTAPLISSVVPANNSTSALTGTSVTVTFNEAMNPATITSSTFILKQGSAVIAGSVSCTGAVATFTPSSVLAANTIFSATITNGAKDVAGNALAANYTWSFTTAGADVTAPTVLSVVPASGSATASTTTKPTVTFSEAMNSGTITSTTFTLKQGTTAVAGTVSYSGTTATFTPSSALAVNTVYTGTVTTGVKDVSGNALAANYTWTFTTASVADVTPPTVVTVVPLANATSVGVSSAVTATFSEAMNSSLITTSTFTLKQGTTSVAGIVTYSGTTATFTPTAALAGGTVYTASITTGVKDVAGNALASVYTWTFTTAAVIPAGKSFSADVVPILNLCNTCHTHPWTPSTNASTFYASLLSGGYINTTTPTTGKIYVKLTGGHPPGSTVSAAQVTTILTWITEGSKNN